MTISEFNKVIPVAGMVFRTYDGTERELIKISVDKETNSVIIFSWFFTATLPEIEGFYPPKELNPI